MQKKYFLILNFILILISSILIANFLTFPIIDSDSGYYLGISKAIYSGKIYFKEIATLYNPLSILVFGLPFAFSDQIDVRISLIINLIFIFGSCFFLFKIVSQFLKSKTEIFFYSLFFILGTINLEARSVLLEPISVFFQISGFYFYLNYKKTFQIYKLIIAGILISLSFLSKQYGLFLLIPIGLDLLLNRNDFLKKTVAIALGLLMPIFLFYLYLSSYGVDIFQFTQHILGNGTKIDKGFGTGLYYNLSVFAITTAVFLIANSYLLILPFLIFKIKKFNFKDNLIYLLPAIFSTLVLLKASFYHYFQYILPYTIITFAYLCSEFENKFIKYLKNISFFMSILFISYTNLKPFKNVPISYKKQILTANEINSYIPKKSKVFLHGISQEFYFLCDFDSINIGKIGFGFPEYYYPKTIVSNIDSGSYLLVSNEFNELYSNFSSQFYSKKIKLNDKIYFILKKK